MITASSEIRNATGIAPCAGGFSGIGNRMDLFQLYTVSETLKPIRASGGMKIIPDYTLETAPAAKVIVIPA